MFKMGSLFSGIGAFEAALDNIGIDFELAFYCEIDKYASKSYSAIHGVLESMNYGDITKIDEKKLPKDIDLITYGFPCQDISLAGKQKGLFNEDGSQTRSGLFFEALRIIEETQPKVAIAENVKNLVGKKFKEQFQIVLDSLEQAGYNNYWKVLNAKDYGIPQNRERVFIVSIRKDIDTGVFEFPEPYELKLRLKDMLEDEVDEKYYISRNVFGDFISEPQGKDIQVLGYMTGVTGRFEKHQSNTVYGTDGVCPTQYAGQYKDPFRITVRTNNSKGYDIAEPGDYINIERPGSTTRRGRVGHGVSQTLDTKENYCVVTDKFAKNKNVHPDTYINMVLDSGCDVPCAVDEQNVTIRTDGTVGTLTTDGSSPKHNNRVIVTSEPFIVASRGRNPENPSDRTTGSPTEQRLEPNSQGICNTLTTVQKDNYVVEPSIQVLGNYSPSGYDASRIVHPDGLAPTVKENHGTVTATTQGLRIRKLTPKECFRLMGFDDEDFEKAQVVCSNTQLYKQAGNSIVVDVLEELFCMMFDEDGELYV